MNNKSFEVDTLDINLNETIFNDVKFDTFYNEKINNNNNNLILNQFQPFITAFPLPNEENSDLNTFQFQEYEKSIMNPLIIQPLQPYIGGIDIADSSSSSKDDSSKSNGIWNELINYNNYHQPFLHYNTFPNYFPKTI